MKKIVSLFSVLMLVSGIVFAGGIEKDPKKPSHVAVVNSGDVVKVFYKTEKPGKVKVKIFNQDNREVFSEEVKSKGGFIRPYNLKSLPEGEYRFTVEDENGVSEENISTVPVKVEAALAQVIKYGSEQLAVTLYSKKGADLNVRIMDENQNVLFTESYNVSGGATKLYSLKNITGKITVEVTDDTGLIKSSTLEK